MKRVVSVCLAGTVGLLVAACSNESTGQPVPTTRQSGAASSTASSGAGLPHSGAPAVPNPLPKSVVESDPCESLTDEQMQQALGDNAPAGKRDDIDTVGPLCAWHDAVSGSRISVGFDTAQGEGLSAVYANSKPKSSSFEPLSPIAGYPAVQYQIGSSDYTCLTSVGLADEYSVTVNFGTTPHKVDEVQPCEVSTKITDMVVGNLKQKAGG